MAIEQTAHRGRQKRRRVALSRLLAAVQGVETDLASATSRQPPMSVPAPDQSRFGERLRRDGELDAFFVVRAEFVRLDGAASSPFLALKIRQQDGQRHSTSHPPSGSGVLASRHP